MKLLMRKGTKTRDAACEITEPEFRVGKYRHALGNFRLRFTRLEGKGIGEMELWVLRMEPEVEEHAHMNLLVQKSYNFV